MGSMNINKLKYHLLKVTSCSAASVTFLVGTRVDAVVDVEVVVEGAGEVGGNVD